ncbi:MAG: leucine-rich repeat domain-containing protein [Spirochaetes bacterium]|nr:leucine-rich repeat domain-containing protein [Spirochaetota bacterium]
MKTTANCKPRLARLCRLLLLPAVLLAIVTSCENPVMQRLLTDLNPPVVPPPASPGPTPGHYFVLNQINPVAPNIATIIGFNPSASFYGRLEIPAVIDGRVVTQIASIMDAPGFMFHNMGLTSVVIPDSVTTIGTASFANNNISSLTLGSGVRSIGFGAFDSNALQSVTIPNNVETIASSAFINNPLTSISIGGMVTIDDTPATPAFNLGFAEVYRAAVFYPWWQRARFVRPAYPPDNTNWSRAE